MSITSIVGFKEILVPIFQIVELHAQDLSKGLTDECSLRSVLAQAASEEIDVVRVAGDKRKTRAEFKDGWHDTPMISTTP